MLVAGLGILLFKATRRDLAVGQLLKFQLVNPQRVRYGATKRVLLLEHLCE